MYYSQLSDHSTIPHNLQDYLLSFDNDRRDEQLFRVTTHRVSANKDVEFYLYTKKIPDLSEGEVLMVRKIRPTLIF